jgi:hypothetical protein
LGTAVEDSALAESPVPIQPLWPLSATTVNVYVVPGTRPVTVQLVLVPVQVAPPGDAVTV